MTVTATLFFGAACAATILLGTAGFGVSEIARAALRNGIIQGLRREVLREQLPQEFSRTVTVYFILGNFLLVASAAGAIAAGMMLYRNAPL